MKRCKSLTLKVKDKEYLIAYKTKLGFVNVIRVYELIDEGSLEGDIPYKSCNKVDCQLETVSTFTDWLRYILNDFIYKFRNKEVRR